MSNTIIADWEYLQGEQMLNVYLEHLVRAAHAYATIMGTVRQQAMDDGGGVATVCENNAAFMTQVAGKLADAQTRLKGRADAFVSQIDHDDQFLYGEL